MLLKIKGEDLDQAQQMHEVALAIQEKVLGHNHEAVAVTLNLLAEVARKQGKFEYDGAERLYVRALDINMKFFGEEHPEVAENLNGLAQVYKGQLNYPKAEQYFLKSITISEKTLGLTHPHVVNRYHNLADLYERWGRVDLAQTIDAIHKERMQKRNEEELLMKKEAWKVQC
eukprot:TRINITY_DN4397_c0_g1_i13.p1 TRINITY_DN4397_c0_g1~~TRINITY_DN4397_c0_g1_i13.p1  ORF type:complete len:172 (-),score=45.25 TRINITY_DN4397_c0_g1_i13:223-738(-)